MQLLCKYYVELSRYREATCFIREGLDLTQLHFCKRRLTQFLLHQINTDLIASNLTEAFLRLDIVEKLLKNKSNKSSAYSLSLLINDDIIQIKNYMHYNLLKILNFIKQGNFSECLNLFETHILKLYDILTKKSIQSASSTPSSQALSPTSSPSIVSLASKYLSLRGSSCIPSLQASNSIFNELFVEIYLHLCNAAKLYNTNPIGNALISTSTSIQLKTKDLNNLLASLRQILIESKTTTLLYEKWYLAEYYCLLYENSSKSGKNLNLSFLNTAYDLIKLNPHPYLYRRICIHLFNSLMNMDESGESDTSVDDTNFGDVHFTPGQDSDYTKVAYLLETQSIALRHKACAIQIKNKRKSLIDAKLYDQLNSLLAFNTDLKKFYCAYLNDHLPNDWSIISIILLDNFDMYLVRLEKNYEPYLLKLKFDANLIKIFKEIIHENDLSMKQSERTKFWSTRSLINSRLSQFLTDLDENVFSFARIFLLGTYKSAHQPAVDKEIQAFCEKFKLSFSSSINTTIRTRKASSLAASASQLQPLTKLQKQILHLLFNAVELSSQATLMEAFKYARFSPKQCEQFTEYFTKNESQFLVKFSAFERKHVCLLIDKSLHQIPWECLPTLRQQTITRMPSIHFLLAHLKTCAATINKQNAFYIVDPGGDLVHTKEKFTSFFQSQQSWEGIIGVAPDESQFKKALTEYQLFIYTGHGSGSQYYPSEDVQKIRVQACSILMGCSSGNQYVMGDFEPYGTILAYILAGCPCVVGNLWDVTDRDIDRLTEEFLQSWLNTPDQNQATNNICVHLNKARSTCKMSHLNGSAPVIYGLPVYFK